MKRVIKLSLLILMLVVAFTAPVLAQDNSIKVFIKGKPLDLTVILENNRILTPIKLISNELGFDVEYLDGGKLVRIRENGISIELGLDSLDAKVNGQQVELDVKPFIKDKTIFVPLRFISETLGEKVIWDRENKVVLVGEFTDETSIEDSFLYFNEEYNYTLSFPNSWKEEAIIETKEGTLYVYDKKSAERFIEDGYESFGPVFEIRSSDYPVTASYDWDYLLDYRDGKYIEVLFCQDFQFYPETLDSYKKIASEAEKILGSFRKIDENNSFVEDNKEFFKNEIELLEDVIDNYVPGGIFENEEITTYRYPKTNSSFLYTKVMKDKEEVLIKIESNFDPNGSLTRYHLKNYGYDLNKNELSQSEALKLANDFVNKYVGEIELIKEPDLYPSLYEENKHESYGDKDGKHIIVVDLEYGFIEYYAFDK